MRGKLEVEGPPAAPQLASQLARAEGSHVCQLCLRRAPRWAAPAREARRPPGGRAGRRPRWPRGAPRRPGGERSHLTRRHGACSGPPGASGARAFPPEPRRGCPRAASPAPSTNQRGRRALRTRGLSAPRRPGTAVLPAVLPAGARDAAARRLPSGVDASPGGREISPKQCRAGKFHPAREQKQGASSLASMKSESFSPRERMKIQLKQLHVQVDGENTNVGQEIKG